jgi:hypothetical protein
VSITRRLRGPVIEAVVTLQAAVDAPPEKARQAVNDPARAHPCDFVGPATRTYMHALTAVRDAITDESRVPPGQTLCVTALRGPLCNHLQRTRGDRLRCCGRPRDAPNPTLAAFWWIVPRAMALLLGSAHWPPLSVRTRAQPLPPRAAGPGGTASSHRPWRLGPWRPERGSDRPFPFQPNGAGARAERARDRIPRNTSDVRGGREECAGTWESQSEHLLSLLQRYRRSDRRRAPSRRTPEGRILMARRGDGIYLRGRTW